MNMIVHALLTVWFATLPLTRTLATERILKFIGDVKVERNSYLLVTPGHHHRVYCTVRERYCSRRPLK